MYLISIRAGVFGVLLVMVSVPGTATRAQIPAVPQTLQTQPFDEGDPPKIPEEPARQVPKTSFAFRASESFLAGGTAFDMTTTARSLDHPTTALRSDGSFLTNYYVRETGWARIFGSRDPYTAVAANVVLNYGIDRFSRNLYLRGGRWRTLSLGTVLLKGALNSWAAASNIRNDERIDAQVRLATGYRGVILWSR